MWRFIQKLRYRRSENVREEMPGHALEGFAGSYFGRSVARAGDVNGDGYADLVVAASTSNTAYVYLGGATPLRGAPITLVSPRGGSNFGADVSSAGDVNGDGYADLLVGAFASSTAYVYLGGAGATALSATPITLRPPSGITGFGTVTEAGDVNGDGFADVVVGAYVYQRAFLYLGGPGATPWKADPICLDGPDGSGFGGVASAGDLNRDGYGDFFVVAGAVDLAQVYLGGPDWTMRGAAPIVVRGPRMSYFGSSQACAGDVNGDGYGDFAVGAFGANAAYVYLGRAGSPPFGATPIALRGLAGTRFGVSVARAGRRDRCRVMGGG